MKKKVITFMNKHHLLKKNSTVLIAVSGGPDSMALLHFYLSIKEEWELNLIAISVDHKLRGRESKADLQYVQDICREWDIELIETSLNVKNYKKEKQVGTQVAAREVRYQFFSKQMIEMGADYLALGHHGDDQVETMLMSFARSTSLTALSGIPVKRRFTNGYIVRPFLCLTKAEIIDYCKLYRINPRIDSSNEDTSYTRNYFRKYLIPIIKEKNNNIHTTVQRLSELLQDDERYLQKKAQEMVDTAVIFNNKNNEVSLLINVFKSYSLSLQRRAYHLILNYLYSELPTNLSYVHEDIFFSLLDKNKGNIQVDFPNGLQINRQYSEVIFSFESLNVAQTTFDKVLTIPGEVNLSNGSTITADYTDDPIEDNKHTFICGSNSISLPLHIRTRKPGDRMSWKGLEGSKKIKDLFIDLKIPKIDRDLWPIVTDNNDMIIWLVGLRKRDLQITAKETSYIQLKYEEGTT